MKLKYLIAFMLVSGLSSAQAAGFDSQYTSVEEKDCKTLEVEEIDSAQSCPGFASLEVMVIESDLRQSLILSKDGNDYPLDFQTTVSAGMSTLGPKIEWRYPSGKANHPVAMIVRLNVVENPDKPEKKTSYLIVSKLNGETICVVGTIPPVNGQNQKARDMADQARDMPCLDAPAE